MAENIPIVNSNVMAKRPAETPSVPKKMSFASVVAMPPKNAVHKNGSGSDEKAKKPPVVSSIVSSQSPSQKGLSIEKLDQDVIGSLSGLGIKDVPDLVSDLSEQNIRGALPSGSRLDDEKTYLSVSSTKAPSLDGKSVASGTTFEKESVRPEDSASMKAEDEDSNSAPGSGAQNSRMGSEAGGKAFHNQLQEISYQRPVPLARRLALGNVDDSRRGVLQPSSAMNVASAIVGTDTGLPAVPQFQQALREPDDKLLEALESPKDRLFLLQLEQQFIAFIQDSQQHVLDLPPCNSFCRLLAHRLGDYYRLPHYVDNSVTSVRLHKTPNTQLPTPLSAYSPSIVAEEVPSVQPSMKIMRRAGMWDGQMTGSSVNTATSSVGPSKSSSEAGEDGQKASGIASPTESMISKDKASQSREEREAKYKEARDRIFADWKEEQNAEALQANEIVNDASRASSVSGKKEKRNKRNKNDDDEFQARSAYSIVYSNSVRQAPAYEQPAAPMNYYNQYMHSTGQLLQPGYSQPYSQQFQQVGEMQGYQMQMQAQSPMPQVPAIYPQNGIQQPYMTYHQQSPQIPGQYYPAMQQQSQMLSQHPSMSSPALNSHGAQLSRPQSQMSDQGWGYQFPYPGMNNPQSHYQTQGPPMIHGPQLNSIPSYQYGQLPFQPSVPGGRTPHPVPGSYNRQNFNPQTRSFVPSLPSTYSDRLGPPPAIQGMNMPAGLIQSQVSPIPSTHFVPPFPGPGNSSPRKLPSQAPRSQSPGQSTLSKWGTPSTLPPKPPPPASPRVSSNGSTLGTQSMPTFQNGTYSKPSMNPQEAKAS